MGPADSGVADLGYHYASGLTPAYPNPSMSRPMAATAMSALDAAYLFQTIGKAFATAQDGTVIHLASGQYTTNTEAFPLTLNGLTPSAQILGTNPHQTIITAAGVANSRVLSLTSLGGGTTIQGVTITGGKITAAPLNGAGAYVYACGNLTFASCVVSNNTIPVDGAYGGGMYIDASAVTLSNCVVERNSILGTGQWVYGGGIRPGLQRTTDHS